MRTRDGYKKNSGNPAWSISSAVAGSWMQTENTDLGYFLHAATASAAVNASSDHDHALVD